jgi:hypothetical protein
MSMVLSVDPGETCGWALAACPSHDDDAFPIHVMAIGSFPAKEFLRKLRHGWEGLVFVVIEEPAPRGTVETQRLLGRIQEILYYRDVTYRLVSPGLWKQYPGKHLQRVKEWMCGGDDYTAADDHAKDALGLLAWWWTTSGKGEAA